MATEDCQRISPPRTQAYCREAATQRMLQKLPKPPANSVAQVYREHSEGQPAGVFDCPRQYQKSAHPPQSPAIRRAGSRSMEVAAPCFSAPEKSRPESMRSRAGRQQPRFRRDAHHKSTPRKSIDNLVFLWYKGTSSAQSPSAGLALLSRRISAPIIREIATPRENMAPAPRSINSSGLSTVSAIAEQSTQPSEIGSGMMTQPSEILSAPDELKIPSEILPRTNQHQKSQKTATRTPPDLLRLKDTPTLCFVGVTDNVNRTTLRLNAIFLPAESATPARYLGALRAPAATNPAPTAGLALTSPEACFNLRVCL